MSTSDDQGVAFVQLLSGFTLPLPGVSRSQLQECLAHMTSESSGSLFIVTSQKITLQIPVKLLRRVRIRTYVSDVWENLWPTLQTN